ARRRPPTSRSSSPPPSSADVAAEGPIRPTAVGHHELAGCEAPPRRQERQDEKHLALMAAWRFDPGSARGLCVDEILDARRGSAAQAALGDDRGVLRVRALERRARGEALLVLDERGACLEELEAEHVAQRAAEDHVGHREALAEDERALADRG